MILMTTSMCLLEHEEEREREMRRRGEKERTKNNALNEGCYYRVYTVCYFTRL